MDIGMTNLTLVDATKELAAQETESVEPIQSVPAGSEALVNPDQLMSADPSAFLEMLRDLHLPAAVSWWPPAPGWWLLLGIALLAYLGWRYSWYEKWFNRRHLPAPPSADVAALEEIARVRAVFVKNGDVHELVASLSILLRRVAMEFFSRDKVAALTGESWLKWLDGQVQSESFSAGVGRAFVDAPYRNPTDVAAAVDGDALLRVCEEWVVAVAERKTT